MTVRDSTDGDSTNHGTLMEDRRRRGSLVEERRRRDSLVEERRRRDSLVEERRRRGRGSASNSSGRFERESRQPVDDGWDSLESLEPFATRVQLETAKSIISRNDSPDISFSQSINTYRGCEHGCSYCYARPTHCYLGHSAGLDFESQLYAKPNAAQLLERELARPRYKPDVIVLGTNTDPYQPIERDHKLTRAILEVMERTRHPVVIVTKSASVVRDIDILSSLARHDLVKVALSITTLDRKLARAMEPRASTPSRRIDAIKTLSEAGIPAGVMVAPVIPALNDPEIEQILESARDAGATEAAYVLLRLPLEIKQLFREWLEDAYPDKARHVISLLQSMHGGQDYEAEFGLRRRGRGPYAQLIAKRFTLALRRLGLNDQRLDLRTDLFERPPKDAAQLQLF